VPISGSFELTPLCNLDCKMCYVHLEKDQLAGADLLTAEKWKGIMQQAVANGMMYARLTGGECLTYPAFKELYLFLRSMGVEVSILSNGILMDENMVSFLAEHMPAAIQITLYGASDDAYEKVTGRRAFVQVSNNLRRIRDAELPLQVAITPNEFMEDGEEIISFLDKEGIKYQINSGLLKPREETGRDLADADIDTYIKLQKIRIKLNNWELEPDCDPASLPETGGKNTGEARGVKCGAGRSNFAIDWRGYMRPCNTFPCDGYEVLKDGFAESWKAVNQLANNFPRPVECEECPYKKICKHCIAEHASVADIGHASPMICAWARRMVEEGLVALPKP